LNEELLVRESVGKSRGGRFSRQVTERVAGRVAPYVEPPIDKAVGESLEMFLLKELLGK
jgi:hypothetical protein